MNNSQNNALNLAATEPSANTQEVSTIEVSTLSGWAVKLRHFPAELKDKTIWCVWRYLVRDAKPTKVPMQLNGRMAKSNDPQTWATFTDACAAADADGELGVGVFCDGSFTFIDLDHCRDAETGAVEPWATRILNRVGSFRELSPSHTGFHIFAEGGIASAVKKNGVEMYSRGRFATVTGDGAFGEFMPCRELS